jgi:hypothetical protein
MVPEHLSTNFDHSVRDHAMEGERRAKMESSSSNFQMGSQLQVPPLEPKNAGQHTSTPATHNWADFLGVLLTFDESSCDTS